MNNNHCCFNTSNELIYSSRIHVPLAKKCSLGCVYCRYYEDQNITENVYRPGTSGRGVFIQNEIADYLMKKLSEYPDTRIIGVSGPGDPMENIESLKYLIQLMEQSQSDLRLCICTNGRTGFSEGKDIYTHNILDYITFTINTLDPEKMLKIYRGLRDISDAKQMLFNQQENIHMLKSFNKKIKINTVYLEDINAEEIMCMFEKLQKSGVDCFNVLPYVSTNYQDGRTIGNMEQYNSLIKKLKENNFPIVKQCLRCRADFCGV